MSNLLFELALICHLLLLALLILAFESALFELTLNVMGLIHCLYYLDALYYHDNPFRRNVGAISFRILTFANNFCDLAAK